LPLALFGGAHVEHHAGRVDQQAGHAQLLGVPSGLLLAGECLTNDLVPVESRRQNPIHQGQQLAMGRWIFGGARSDVVLDQHQCQTTAIRYA